MTGIVLIGCGNMGFAMLDGWLSGKTPPEVHAVEPDAAYRARASRRGARAVATLDDLPQGLSPRLVVVAVKPDKVSEVLGEAGRFAASGTVFLSIAAGVTLASMARALPEGARTIRCMPNTPASVGAGMFVLTPGAGIDDETRRFVTRLFETAGAVAWIEEEGLMDAVTAISGSGPAYVFHVIEALTAAGESLGLPRDTALLLARQTVAGAGKMAKVSATPPGELREQVTSPGGTTAAALEILMGDGALARLFRDATRAARDRSVELGRDS